MSLLEDVRALREETEAQGKAIDRHEEQINGKRGLSASIDVLAVEVRSLRRAAYWVAGVIVVGAVSFAFSVLTLFGGG